LPGNHRYSRPTRDAAHHDACWHGVLFLSAAVATFVFGEWHWQFGPIAISGRRARKPLTIALVFLVLAVAFEPKFRGALRERSLLAFYAVATTLCRVMCLGPTGRMMGEMIFEKPPYWWLMKLPGVENLRVPTRFAMVAMLPLAITAALAFARLLKRVPVRAQPAATGVCVLLMALDSWPRPLPLHAPREQYTLPAAARDAAVIELPLGNVVDNDIAAMVRGCTMDDRWSTATQAARVVTCCDLRSVAGCFSAQRVGHYRTACIVIDRRLLLAELAPMSRRSSPGRNEFASTCRIGSQNAHADHGAATIVSAVANNWPALRWPRSTERSHLLGVADEQGREAMTLTLEEPATVSGWHCHLAWGSGTASPRCRNIHGRPT
jgi:hypothetical protein